MYKDSVKISGLRKTKGLVPVKMAMLYWAIDLYTLIFAYAYIEVNFLNFSTKKNLTGRLFILLHTEGFATHTPSHKSLVVCVHAGAGKGVPRTLFSYARSSPLFKSTK